MPNTIKPGMTFLWHHADSNAKWKVLRPTGGGVFLCEIISEDWKGTQQPFTSQQILGSIKQQEFWANYKDDGEHFFALIPVGSIVHVDNGFNQFIRHEVVMFGEKKTTKAIALVGNWNQHDLPRRKPDGTIHYPYHAQKVISNEFCDVNPNNLLEYQVGKNDKPISLLKEVLSMEPISLDVPEMDENEKHLAENYKLAQNIIQKLNVTRVNDELLDSIVTEINELRNQQ